jgi:hypothetical protein
MKTDDLIAMLAQGVAPVALMLLTFGIRPDLGQAVAMPMFWVKLAFPLAVAVPAVLLTARLAHPGMRMGHAWQALPLPWIVLAAMAIAVLTHAPPDQRLPLVFGQTWLSCAFSIAFVSLPVLIGMLWAVKGLAPTRPTWAGACAGLASAAVGTTVYALHCPEMQAPFVAVWYLLGMLIPAALGAFIGSQWLRW